MQIPVGRTDVPVAVIGMACRLPGADNLEQFWQLLVSGGSAVVELPHERLDRELYYDPRRGQRGKSYAKLGAIVSSRQFDRNQCAIPSQLERAVDNAHLLMCQTAATACRHAGLDPFQLPLRNTGVFIGHAQGSDLAGEYTLGTSIEEAAQFLREVPGFQELPPPAQEEVLRELIDSIRFKMPQRAADSPDVAINMVAGTISKAFGLNGPFMAVNSACASSLQATMYGVRALQMGRIDMAIVGGASDCKSDSLVLFSHAQSMSETGSRPFDAGADGLICSEGYVSLVLKTLDRALADGDPIQAVIRGLGASCDGKGKSLWAPRKEGQVKAMARAYRNGLDMATLQYIEAHATSTNLGDATELNALGEILAEKFPAGKKIPITSVKANIGHALESAGLSSVIKTILCLQHHTFVPAINIETLNPKINWDTAPFYIQRELAPWPAQADGLPRRAAVNAFGIGGLNVHIVLDEFSDYHRQMAATTVRRETPADDGVAVIGMGCILPGSADVAKFQELLTSGRDPKTHAPAERLPAALVHEPGPFKPYRTPATLGGFITDFAYDWRRHKVPPKQVAEADPLQFMLLDAAEQALVDSGYDKKPFDRERVSVIVGTEFGSDFSIQLELGLKLPHVEKQLRQLLAARGVDAAQAAQIAAQYGETMLKHWPALVDESGSFSTSTLASRITKTMNLMGGAAALDAGNASGAAALAQSVDALLSGDCDMMICAAGQRCLSLAAFEGMASVGVLATSENPAGPFDASGQGIVPGEGVGVVLLKRLADARRDGDRIHAIIRGIGAAHSLSGEEAQRVAVERALKIAHVAPADIAVLEIDGSGLPDEDQEQLRATLAVYGTAPRAEPLLLGCVTGQIGHTVGASAMASLIKASLQVESGEMPATFGVRNPLDLLRNNAGVVRTSPAREPVRHTTHDGRRLAAVTSYGKGLAYHIVLERGEKVPVVAPAPVLTPAKKVIGAPPAPVTEVVVSTVTPAHQWRIVRLGAGSPAELAAKVQATLADSAGAYAAASRSVFVSEQRVRLAIVASSAEMLLQKLQTAAKQLGNPAALPVLEQQGCFYRQLGAERPRVAFLFPGQGSHYAGMLRELVRDVPAAAAKMHEVDAVMARRGLQTFGQMAWENPQQLGADVWVTQVVMLLADTIVHAALTDLGVRPDMVAGHSYGEYAALTASGAWDLDAVVTAARARYDGIEATPTARGTMMATTAPPELIEQLAATLADRTYPANFNAPDQTVVGGRPETLQVLAGLLEARGHKSQLLPVPCPFHTPLMAGAGAILRRTLDTLRINPPRIPFASTVTNRFVAEPDDIRTNLAAQLTTAVRWVDLVNRLAAERDTVFVEVGPQQALTRLNRRILEGRGVAGVIACDNPKRPGIEQLLCVKALLECTGAIETPVLVDTTPTRAAAAPAARGTVMHVDATERRRDKMRHSAHKDAAAGINGNGDAGVKAHHGENGSSVVGHPLPTPANGNGNGSGLHAEPVTVGLAPRKAVAAAFPTSAPPVSTPQVSAPPMAPPVAQVAAATPHVAPQPAPAAPQATAQPAAVPSADLEKFLINFVVEQTGYPPEVVELDADLEADLGIDSIKKAQLFGELAEYFDVQPTEGMTLDDFPTLRHVLNFLAAAPMKEAGVESIATVAPAPVAQAAVPQATVPQAAVPQTTVAPPTAHSVAAAAPQIAPQAATVAPPAAAQPTAVPSAELEKFLINFVVEQTGYPPEVVELDADLEADLGIDSIKKAQLFGELAEYFDVQPTEGMTLDDFPTLRHVLNFLAAAPMKGAGTESVAPVAVAPAPASQVTVPQAAVAPPAVQPVAAAAPHFASQPAAVAPRTAAQPTAVPSAELEKFLINFVVEQTGYPPEVVELDADLEADLGIDSIKKAQLFGELAEYFDVQPTEGMTLDDFPTLRHVLNFLAAAPMKGAAAEGAAAATPIAAAPAAAAAPVTVAPIAAAAPAVHSVAPPAVQPVAASSQVTVQVAPQPAAAAPQAAAQPAAVPSAELEKFLINFVVEQTGYPPEVVELDADLEADLGIDSIKKAQLFGELAEYFDVQPTEGMTLDDFPTLRHVLNFLAAAPMKGTEDAADLKKNLTPSQFEAPSHSEPGMVAATSAATATAQRVAAVEALPEATPSQSPELLRLAGTPYQMGFAHGQIKKGEIRRLLRRYADLAGPEFAELPTAVPSPAELDKHFSADEIDELQGLADAVGVRLSNIVAHNTALFADFGTSSSQFAVAAAQNAAGQMIHAASEDLPLSSALRNCLQPVVHVRQPAHGIPHLMVSFLGSTGGLMGINAHGLAVTACAPPSAAGNRATVGRAPAAVVATMLAQAVDVDGALALLAGQASRGEWAVCLSHQATDRVCRAQSDGHTVQVHDRADAAPHGQLSAAATATADAKYRADDLARLLARSVHSGITAEAVKVHWLHPGGENNGSSTHGAHDPTQVAGQHIAVIFDHSQGDLWIQAPGIPASEPHAFCRLRITDLLPDAAANQSVTAPAIARAKYDLNDLEPDQTHRFTLRMIDAPWKAQPADMPTWQGAALVVGNNPAADAMRSQLQSAGVKVCELPVNDGIDVTLTAFEQLWNEQPIPHLFIMTAHDKDRADPLDEAGWRRRWNRVALLPYFLSQRFLQLAGQAKVLDRCSLILCTALDGTFGYSDGPANPECGALTGLAKSIYIEFVILRGLPGMMCKAIDFPDDEPPVEVARNICRELASKAIDFEVAFVRGARQVPNARPVAAPVEQFAEVRPGGTWVVTGGTRGITAECALEIGRRFGLKLHLIGMSPLRPIDPAWRGLSSEQMKALKASVMRDAAQAGRSMEAAWSGVKKDIEVDAAQRAFAAAGVQVTYHACDVADGAALAQVLDAIRQQDGPIEGIVHGAGIERSCAFERKKRDVVMATLGAKVDGAVNLMRLTWQDPVRHFLSFGSIAGRLGSNGQTDYSLASDALCKLAGWYQGRRRNVQSVGFHWHPWDGVGMAANPETVATLKIADGPKRMPKDMGIKHLLRELYSRARAPEVLITDWEYHGRYYGTEHHPKPGAAYTLPQPPVSATAPVSRAAGVSAPAKQPNVQPAAPLVWDPAPQRVASRYALTMIEASLPAHSTTTLNFEGPACILGDNPTARALRDRLTAAGVAVHMLPVAASADEAVAAIELAYQQFHPHYLFLMSGRDEGPAPLLDKAAWQRRRAAGLVAPFLTAQQWFRLRMKAKDTTPITIVAATSLGGDFGLSGQVPLPDSGALTGLLKSLYIEDSRKPQREVRVKAIDAPADEPPTAIVEAIFRELAADAPDVEVAWTRGVRRIVRSVLCPVESLPRQGVPRGGNWVATGGARGITAAVALEIGKRFGAKLHLIGRSTEPQEGSPWRNCTDEQLDEIKAQIVRRSIAEGRSPEREWERVMREVEIEDTLKKFVAAGVQVTYHSCDLADWDQLAAVLADVRRADGPIDGIIHGAGYADSGRFGTRNREKLERTFAGKLDGAVGLMSLTQQDPVRYFVGFGSISGRFGGNGLADYAAANDMLAKLIAWYRTQRPDCASSCLHWQSWDEIGMAMLGDSNVGTKGILKMEFISPREGVDHLCRELDAGLPTAEVLVTDGFFERTFYPFTVAATPVAPSAGAIDIAQMPLVDVIRPRSEGAGSEAEIRFDPTVDPFLLDHQLRGKPFLPAVVALEAQAEAASLATGRTVTALRNVQMLDGLAFRSERPIVARVLTAPQADGTVACEFVADFHNRAGKLMHKDRLLQRSTAVLAEHFKPYQAAMPEPPTEWIPYEFSNNVAIYHGPTLQGMKGAKLDEQGGWAQLVALPLRAFGGVRPGQGWIIPGTVLDAAFYACGTHAFIWSDGGVTLPQSLEWVRRGRMPRDNEKCLVQLHCRELQDQYAIYDFTIYGEDRAVILAVEGHRMVMLRRT